MMTFFSRLAALGLGIVAGAAAAPALAAPDVAEIVARANHAAYYQGQDGRARVDMTIRNGQGRESSRRFTILRLDNGPADRDGEQSFYVYFNRPADVNRTAFLALKRPGGGDDRWLYLPALDLVKRIAPSDERTSFIGAHFFYEDVSGRDPARDSHQLVEETDAYYVLESTPKQPEQVEFARYKSWIHKASFIPVKIEYTDAAGAVYRVYEALAVDRIGDYPTVTRARMTDTRIGGETVMSYSQVDYDIGLDAAVFTEQSLRNPPRRFLRSGE